MPLFFSRVLQDHKPSREDETERIKGAGGMVIHKRVMGELAVSRAFGDRAFKIGIKVRNEKIKANYFKEPSDHKHSKIMQEERCGVGWGGVGRVSERTETQQTEGLLLIG